VLAFAATLLTVFRARNPHIDTTADASSTLEHAAALKLTEQLMVDERRAGHD
jgi:hypothetical protein